MTIRRRLRGNQTVSAGAESSPDTEPSDTLAPADLRMLASAIAGRNVTVAAATDGIAHTDGTTIFVGPEHTTTTVCVQAALIGAGSLHTPAVRRVLARSGAASRYVTLEAARASVVLDGVLPQHVVSAVSAHWSAGPMAGPLESALAAVKHKDVPNPPSDFGTLRRSALAAPDHISNGGNADEDEAGSGNNDSDVEKSSLLMAARFDNAFTQLMRNIITPSAGSSDEDNGGVEMAVKSAARKARAGQHGKVVLSRVGPRTAAPPDTRGTWYPEWNFRAAEYRPNWCSAVDVDPAPQPDAEPLHVTPNRELVRAALRVTTVREPHNRQHFGDGLDLGSLVRFEVAHRAGETPDDRVMRARLRTASELSVLLLIDCTGSGAETSGGLAIWEHQREVGAQFLASFDAAGARIAAYGFNSRGRTVQFLRIKSFAGRYGAAARARLAALQPSGYTRMGAAIRHATHLLESEGGSDRRLLIVVSDGFPYDDDYEGTYAENDARRALEEAATRGVGCACFTVESPTEPAALERLWGSATYVQLTSGRRWAEPVEATLQAAMRRAASTQKTRTSTTQGALA